MPTVISKQGNALLTLAYIEAQLNANVRNGSRLEIFQPLIEDALKCFEGTSFSDDDMRMEIEEQFGIELPAHVIRSLLRKCKKAGYLTQKNNSYARTQVPIKYSNFKKDQNRIENAQKELVRDLGNFARDEGIGNLSDSEIEEALYSYLLDCVGYSNEHKPGYGSQLPKDELLWLHKYFRMAAESDSASFDTALSIMKGLAVYSIAFLPGFESEGTSLKGLCVYLDSVVVCEGLGFSSEDNSKFVMEGLKTLRSSGAVIRVYDSTVEEIKRILYALRKDWTNGNFQRSPRTYGYWLKRQGKTSEDIWEIENTLEILIRNDLNTQIVRIPSRKASYVLDEEKLEKRLADPGDIGISERVRHDVNCIAGILTEREGVDAKSMGASRAIFATNSTPTIRSTMLWWTEDESRADIPPIFDLGELASIAWLMEPNEPDAVVRRRFVATCSSALLPSDEIWMRCMNRLDALVANESMSSEIAQMMAYESDLAGILEQMFPSKKANEISDGDIELALEEARASLTEKDVKSALLEQEKAFSLKEDRYIQSLNLANAEKEELTQRLEAEQKERNRANRSSEESVSRLETANELLESKLLKIVSGLSALIVLVLICLCYFVISNIVNLIFPILNSDGSFDNASILGVVTNIVFGLIVPAVLAVKFLYSWLKLYIARKLGVNCME